MLNLATILRLQFQNPSLSPLLLASRPRFSLSPSSTTNNRPFHWFLRARNVPLTPTSSHKPLTAVSSLRDERINVIVWLSKLLVVKPAANHSEREMRKDFRTLRISRTIYTLKQVIFVVCLQTEVLRQLSSMGRLVVCAGDGAIRSPTNLALLRHGISIWIDVPLDIVAREVINNGSQDTASELSTLGSHSELVRLYEDMRVGYSTADATVSLQKVGCQLGCEDLGEVTPEAMALEVLSEIEKLTRVKRMMEDAARPF